MAVADSVLKPTHSSGKPVSGPVGKPPLCPHLKPVLEGGGGGGGGGFLVVCRAGWWCLLWLLFGGGVFTTLSIIVVSVLR